MTIDTGQLLGLGFHRQFPDFFDTFRNAWRPFCPCLWLSGSSMPNPSEVPRATACFVYLAWAQGTPDLTQLFQRQFADRSFAQGLDGLVQDLVRCGTARWDGGLLHSA